VESSSFPSTFLLNEKRINPGLPEVFTYASIVAKTMMMWRMVWCRVHFVRLTTTGDKTELIMGADCDPINNVPANKATALSYEGTQNCVVWDTATFNFNPRAVHSAQDWLYVRTGPSASDPRLTDAGTFFWGVLGGTPGEVHGNLIISYCFEFKTPLIRNIGTNPINETSLWMDGAQEFTTTTPQAIEFDVVETLSPGISVNGQNVTLGPGSYRLVAVSSGGFKQGPPGTMANMRTQITVDGITIGEDHSQSTPIDPGGDSLASNIVDRLVSVAEGTTAVARVVNRFAGTLDTGVGEAWQVLSNLDGAIQSGLKIQRLVTGAVETAAILAPAYAGTYNGFQRRYTASGLRRARERKARSTPGVDYTTWLPKGPFPGREPPKDATPVERIIYTPTEDVKRGRQSVGIFDVDGLIYKFKRYEKPGPCLRRLGFSSLTEVDEKDNVISYFRRVGDQWEHHVSYKGENTTLDMEVVRVSSLNARNLTLERGEPGATSIVAMDVLSIIASEALAQDNHCTRGGSTRGEPEVGFLRSKEGLRRAHRYKIGGYCQTRLGLNTFLDIVQSDLLWSCWKNRCGVMEHHVSEIRPPASRSRGATLVTAKNIRQLYALRGEAGSAGNSKIKPFSRWRYRGVEDWRV